MIGATELAPHVGVEPACAAFGVSRASFYRRRRGSTLSKVANVARCKPPLSLKDEERQAVLDVLHSERFMDRTPQEIVATLLDEGVYHCSTRTMYRILEEEDEIRERRNQCRHPRYTKPELVAKGPNQVWSWDITKLKGPEKGTYYQLYVILDIYSRYVVGWLVAAIETGDLAKLLIEETCIKEGVVSGQLTIHSDRGASMKSKLVADLMADLGVTKSHGRPKVSDDNPYSESQFRTLKYPPEFPQRFGSLEDARTFCRSFFKWYNLEHRHSGIAMRTPDALHHGQAERIVDARSKVLAAAYEAHPNRFKGRCPVAKLPPKEVWINQPDKTEDRSMELTGGTSVQSTTPGETEAALLENNRPRDILVRTHQDGETGWGRDASAPANPRNIKGNRMIDPAMPEKLPPEGRKQELMNSGCYINF